MIIRTPAPLGLITCLAGSIFLSGCNSNGDDGSLAKTTPTRTVLVYMVGSDLESGSNAATNDIREMMQVGSGENLNIVITTGGADKAGWKTVKRHLINKGEQKTLTDLGNLNMGHSDTLRDFLDWGMRSYPASKYTLVFWNHGGGAVGHNGATVGNDENHGNDALSLPEIATALNTVTHANGKRFDLIGFDTCLMATIETAATISPFADYMVASEELEPGSGWDYRAWLGKAKSSPALATLDLGKTIVDSYFASFPAGSDEGKSITLSTIQLARVSAVTTEIGKLARTLGDRLTANADVARIEIAKGRSRSESYGHQNGTDSGMVDINDFLSHLPPALAAEAARVRTNLDAAVVYNRRAEARPNASGLSIYLPGERTIAGGITDDVLAYKRIGYSTFWESVIDRYATAAANDVTAPAFQNAGLVGNRLAVDIPDAPDLSSVEVYITQELPDGNHLVLGREEPDSMVGEHAVYDFDNTVLTMNNQFVFAEVLEEDEDNNRFVLGVSAQVNGQQGQLTVLVSLDPSDNLVLEVVGFLPMSAAGVAPRMMSLNTGDSITPLYLRLNPSTGETDYVTLEGTAFTVPAGGIKASVGALPADTYNAFFAAQDFSGNMAYSDAFALTVGE